MALQSQRRRLWRDCKAVYRFDSGRRLSRNPCSGPGFRVSSLSGFHPGGKVPRGSRARHSSNARTRQRRYLSHAVARPYGASRGRRTRGTRVGSRAHYERGRAQNHRGRISGTRTECYSGASSRNVGEATRPAGVPAGQELPLSGLSRRRKVLLDSPRTRSRRSDARADLSVLASASRRRTASRFLLRPSPPHRRISDGPLQLGA
jgi:hypothetical protein